MDDTHTNSQLETELIAAQSRIAELERERVIKQTHIENLNSHIANLTDKLAATPSAPSDTSELVKEIQEHLADIEEDYPITAAWRDRIEATLRRAAGALTDETAADLLRDVLLSGIEYDNPSISYVTMQLERETLKEIRAFLASNPPRIDA